MKKHIITSLLLSAARFLSGCSENTGNSALADETSSTTVSQPESNPEINKSSPREKIIGIYGETEIPDIPCAIYDDPEGKANDLDRALDQCLDSMIFETHTFGEYTIRLVGDKVRTDKVNFPGSIYTHNLRVEVEKNGKPLETRNTAYYSGILTYVTQLVNEFRLFSDRIGSYLDIYDLEKPLIAMRYFYADDLGRTVTKAVGFAVIEDDKTLQDGFVGKYVKGTGIELNEDTESKDRLILNTHADRCNCFVGMFESDEFKTAGNNALIDEKAGLKYTFDLSEPVQFEYYSVERIE